jgi:hypothetical protein
LDAALARELGPLRVTEEQKNPTVEYGGWASPLSAGWGTGWGKKLQN